MPLSPLWMGFTICGGGVVCGTEATAEKEVSSYCAMVAAAWIHIPTYAISFRAIGIVLIPKKFVAINAAWTAWFAANSAMLGIVASAAP